MVTELFRVFNYPKIIKIVMKSHQKQWPLIALLGACVCLCVSEKLSSPLIFLLLTCLWMTCPVSSVLFCLSLSPCLSFRPYRYSVYSSPARRISRYR